MNSNESSVTDLCFTDDLPDLAKSLPADYDKSFFSTVAKLPSKTLPADSPDGLDKLIDDNFRQAFVSEGPLFSDENKYGSAVSFFVIAKLLLKYDSLFKNQLDFGNNIKADEVVERLVGDKHYLKLLIEYKTPASETDRSPAKAEDLHLQVAQAFAYLDYAYLRRGGTPRYNFEDTVYFVASMCS
jgi:hypothetical protein